MAAEPDLRAARGRVAEHGLLPYLLLAGTVLFWGTSFAATKSAYTDLAPMTVVWLRMIVASLVFLPVWRMLPRPVRRPGDRRVLALSLAFIPCAYFALEGFAIQYTTSSQAGVIAATAPLMVATGAWLVLRERLAVRTVVGILVSMAGVGVLALGGVAGETAPNPLLGNLLEVGAMAGAAGSTITIRHLAGRYDPWFLTGLQMATGALFFAPLALASGPIAWGEVAFGTWAAVAYLGIFPSLVGFGLYNSALRLLPANRAATSLNLIPAVAVLTGWLALGESLSWVQLVACAAIVAAVVWAGTAERQTRGGGEANRDPRPNSAPPPRLRWRAPLRRDGRRRSRSHPGRHPG